MATGQTLIDAALRKLGMLPSGSSATGQEGTDALLEVNRMLAEANNDGLMIHATTIANHTLTNSTQSYTIGSGGTFDTTRPQRIDNANILNTAGTRILDRLNIRDADWWANKRISTNTGATSEDGQPTDLFYNPLNTSARGTIFLSPTPDAAYILELHSWGVLASVSALSTTIVLPESYEDWFVWNLAERLWPEYPNPVVYPVIEKWAYRTTRHIRRMNSVAPSLESDYPGGGRAYDARLGS